MKSSLRWRLFLMIAMSVLFAWIATAFFTYLDTRREIGALLDSRLVKAAGLASAQFIGSDTNRSQQVRDYTDTTLQIWSHDGNLLLSSNTAPQGRLGEQHAGFEDVTINDALYRVYSHWSNDGRINVRVAERAELRTALAESVASHLLHPLYFAVPALGILIWISVGVGLAPLSRFAREVEQRKPDRLEPFELADTPREVLPLQDALNTLFSRLQELLKYERRFTADAAHELRTPLAALKIQAQVAQAALDSGQLEQALNKVIQGADRAAHLVEQLLVLSRLDPESAPFDQQQVRLSAIVNEGIALHAPGAVRKGVDLGCEARDEGVVIGDATLLAILVRNLVDNAVRYTPSGGQVDVRVERANTDVVLRVIDTGPGISKKERQRITSRFYRVLGSGEDGSGLGLSIVERIAELHGAALRFDEGDAGVGLVVSVRFKGAAV